MYVLQFACMHCRLSLKYVIVLRRQMMEENHILRYFVISKSNQFRMGLEVQGNALHQWVYL